MAALRSRCGHYILQLWFLSSSSSSSSSFFLSFFLSFFFSFCLAYSQRSQIGCQPHFHTWCGLSANLECRSEMCCTRLAGNTGRKSEWRKKSLSAQICRAISSQLRHVSTIRKNLLNSNISSTCPHNMVNFGPLAVEICWRVWGTPANFNGFASCLRYCSDVAHRRRTKLCAMFGRLLGCYTMCTFSGALPPDGILPGAKFTLRPSLTFSYNGSITAQQSSGVRQQNLAAWYREWNYGNFAEGVTYIRLGGHHVGHRPTF